MGDVSDDIPKRRPSTRMRYREEGRDPQVVDFPEGTDMFAVLGEVLTRLDTTPPSPEADAELKARTERFERMMRSRNEPDRAAQQSTRRRSIRRR